MGPFADIKTLEDVSSDWAAELSQPFDDGPQENQRGPEVNEHANVSADHTHVHRPTRRRFADQRNDPAAYKRLDVMPAPGESVHGVIGQRWALWEMVPAIIDRTGHKIEELTLASFSFSLQNAAECLKLFDAGQVLKVNLLISYYFKSANAKIYHSLVPQLRERGQRVLAMRNHAKMILARMQNGECFTAESSANLRSGKCLEQYVLTNDCGLYDFHHGWISDELLNGKEEGNSHDEQ